MRHQQGLRLDDTAGSAGVGHVFWREVERGKDSVQLGRVLSGENHVWRLDTTATQLKGISGRPRMACAKMAKVKAV